MRHELVFNLGTKLPSVDNLCGLGLVTEPLWTFMSSLTIDDVGLDGL